MMKNDAAASVSSVKRGVADALPGLRGFRDALKAEGLSAALDSSHGVIYACPKWAEDDDDSEIGQTPSLMILGDENSFDLPNAIVGNYEALFLGSDGFKDPKYTVPFSEIRLEGTNGAWSFTTENAAELNRIFELTK